MMSDNREYFIKEAFELDVIQCTRQPGNLRLAKEACAIQYKHAQERLLKKGKGAFYLGIHSSPEVCGKCSKGRRHFEELSEELKRPRNRHKSRKIRLFKTRKIENMKQGG
jgi:hypothetical protein